VHRYYDPATGQFLTVDPVVSATGAPYFYADDDPADAKDPAGLDTVGVCSVGGAQFGEFSVSPGLCLTRTIDASGEDDIGLTGTLGGAVGAGDGLSVGLYYQLSNASNLKELTGKFYYATVEVNDVAGGSVTVFWSPNHKTYGIEVGVSGGIGVIAGVGISDTGIVQFNNSILANIARGVWDSLNPSLAIAKWLHISKSAISSIESTSYNPSPPNSPPQSGACDS
jgi:hypothetical protein